MNPLMDVVLLPGKPDDWRATCEVCDLNVALVDVVNSDGMALTAHDCDPKSIRVDRRKS